ncbi:MAG TPA: aldehyde dehydrogenase family protein [Solirubrobacteraceae bacterium]|jgi:aldehyde dehydrogenase (NAD+)|nr:aldehyde dehydrogenase family protein [Solirubrobacteraceae bacterium]
MGTETSAPKRYDCNFIGGRWLVSADDARIEVEDPSSERLIALVPAGAPADADAAVTAAAEALDGWSRTSPAERAGYLHALADALESRADEVARLIVSDVGSIWKTALGIQAALPVAVLRSCAELLSTYEFEEQIGNSRVFKEPVGVVAAITPWNYPLHQVTAKVGPALAAGCTIVVKPSEVAPLTAYLLAECVAQVGLPPGVFNLVSGTGPVVGEALVTHSAVDAVSFTGSLAAGRRVGELGARTVKRVVLELGGKSANVILPGADLAKAVKVGVANAFLNQGQTCSAWTRMLVSAESHDEAVELAGAAAAAYQLGPPLDPATRLGPLVSEQQRKRVLSHIENAERAGARLVAGGSERPGELAAGHFVQATVFADVRSDMAIAQEEIFGPVLAILPYDGEEDALRIANDSIYGLSGAVWAPSSEAAVQFARRMRTGQVDINGGRFNPLAPFGGYKQSGNGRELGRYGLEEFLQPKSVQL